MVRARSEDEAITEGETRRIVTTAGRKPNDGWQQLEDVDADGAPSGEAFAWVLVDGGRIVQVRTKVAAGELASRLIAAAKAAGMAIDEKRARAAIESKVHYNEDKTLVTSIDNPTYTEVFDADGKKTGERTYEI